MTSTRPRRVFTATGAMALLCACALVVSAMLIDAAVRSGVQNALLLAPWPLLVLWGVYVIGIASHVRADRRGVQVQNLLRRTYAPWARVTAIAMRWQVELTLDDGSVVRCLGGPAHSRPRRLGPGREREDAGADADDGVAMLRRLSSESAADGAVAGSSADAVVRTWDWAAIGAFVALAAWATAAILITR